MNVLSMNLLYDILEDLIAKWVTRYKLLVARELRDPTILVLERSLYFKKISFKIM